MPVGNCPVARRKAAVSTGVTDRAFVRQASAGHARRAGARRGRFAWGWPRRSGRVATA